MKASWIGIVIVIVIVVAAGVGFGAYTMGKSAGQQQALQARTAFLQARGFGGATGAATGGQGAAAGRNFDPNNFASGQVKTISGNTIELSTATSVVTVQLSAQTIISKTVNGTVSDIQPGERITIQGTRASDGTLQAQSVQIGRAGFPGGNTGAQSAQGGGTQ